ncbi:glycogenin-1 [Panthera uncia]|nr:glycogenin-1 [Panthera uncia]XP_060494889.1 glycogenin-1 [Panthera onca]
MRRHEVPGRCPSGAGPEVPGSWTRAQPRRCWGWQGTRAGRSAGRMPAGAGERARPRDSRYKSAPGGRSAPAAPPRWPRSRPAPGFSQPPTCGCGGRPPLPGSTMTDQAFVTLTTNDAYAKGALVLGSSLKQHRTTRKLVVLATPQVSDSMRKVLETIFDEVLTVDVLDSGDSAHLTLMRRPELGVTLTKLHCWSLTQYSKCVFMDADTLVLANIDDLFEREELSAAPDPGWPDCFNSGVFVYQPSVETYNQLLHLASEQGSFDGGDQGLLNTFFSGWATTDIRKHLPFIYNLSSISIYSYLPAFKAFGANAKVVHFLGRIKPWNYTYDPKTKSVKSESHDPTMTHPEFLNLWWDIFTTNVLPLLQQFGLVKDPHSYLNVEGVSGAVSHLSLGEIPATAQPFVSSEERKERWEQGQADYMGADSFDNIKRKLDTYLQ